MRSFFDVGTGPLFSLLQFKDKSKLDQSAKLNFDAAKKLSDFVGILIRLALVKAVVSYLIMKAQSESGFVSFIFGFTSISAFVLSIVISLRVFIIIFHYELREFSSFNGIFPKIIFGTIAMASTSMIWYCIGIIVRELAPRISQ